jgi:hypothetical protein
MSSVEEGQVLRMTDTIKTADPADTPSCEFEAGSPLLPTRKRRLLGIAVRPLYTPADLADVGL